MENELVSTFFTMQGLGNTIQSLIAAGLVYLLFQKSFSKQLAGLEKQIAGLEKQFIRLDAKMDDLRAELKADIKDLRRDMDDLRRDMNNLCKAVLLHA
jgi:chromosome segregation ATPase